MPSTVTAPILDLDDAPGRPSKYPHGSEDPLATRLARDVRADARLGRAVGTGAGARRTVSVAHRRFGRDGRRLPQHDDSAFPWCRPAPRRGAPATTPPHSGLGGGGP